MPDICSPDFLITIQPIRGETHVQASRCERSAVVVCRSRADDRKDKPVLGLEIIRGAKKADGKEVWEDGKILDPEKGANYSLRLTPIDGGKKLEVRGSVFGIGRTQTWVRAQ